MGDDSPAENRLAARKGAREAAAHGLDHLLGPGDSEVYDKTYAVKFELSVLGPIIDLLAELARGGPALASLVGAGLAFIQVLLEHYASTDLRDRGEDGHERQR